MTRIPTLWEPFGLRSTPFFQDELRPGDREHPVELFVGRPEELQRLVRRIGNETASRSIVQGDPGIGKTSFINRLKSDLSRRGVLTYAHPIRTQSTTTPALLIADALRLLLRVRLAAGWESDGGGFWKRTAQMLEGAELRGGSVTALGVGGGISRGYAAPQVPLDSLYEHLGEALQRLAEEAEGGVVIHVDNVENLTEENIDEAAATLRDLRDHLMLSGAHWIFAGARGVDAAFRRFAQVDGIFPAAETLEPLTAEEVELLLRRRYEHLAIRGRTVTPPIEPATASRLYGLYQGDLRNFLRLLADAAERTLGVAGVRPMSAADVLRHTGAEYGRQLRERLGEADYEHLRRIASSVPPPHEFRVTEIAEAIGVKQSSASQLTDRLLRGGAIRRTRSQGKSIYYRPVGSALVGFGFTDFLGA